MNESKEHNFVPCDRAEVARCIEGNLNSVTKYTLDEVRRNALGIVEAYLTVERVIYEKSGGHFCGWCGVVVDDDNWGCILTGYAFSHLCDSCADNGEACAYLGIGTAEDDCDYGGGAGFYCGDHESGGMC